VFEISGIESRNVKMIISEEYEERRQVIQDACNKNIAENPGLLKANSLKG